MVSLSYMSPNMGSQGQSICCPILKNKNHEIKGLFKMSFHKTCTSRTVQGCTKIFSVQLLILDFIDYSEINMTQKHHSLAFTLLECKSG